MTEKLINGIIVKVQANASAIYGPESEQTVTIVRSCYAELKNARTSQFENIQSKWMSV